MTRLTREEVKLEWNDLCEKAFHELKMRLTTAPILIVPERGQRYIVYCDASKNGHSYQRLTKVPRNNTKNLLKPNDVLMKVWPRE